MASNERHLQALILEYLDFKKRSGVDPDGLDVGIQCIAEAFGVSPADRAAAASGPSLLSIFEKSGAGASAAPGSPSGSASPAGSSPSSGSAAATSAAGAGSAATTASASAGGAADDEAGAEAAKARGNAHVTAGRHAEAIECYSEAIRRAPGGKNVHIYYANRSAAKTSLKEYEGAIADARAAIRANAGFAKGHSRLGAALQSAGRYPEAVAAFEAALELDPANDAARENLQACRAKVGSGAAAPAGGRSGAGRSGAGGSAAAPAGGANPLAGLAGLGGAGGGLGGLLNNPMISQLMSNPQVMQAAQSMMSNPAMMQSMMGMMGGAGGGAGGLGGLGSLFGGMGGAAGAGGAAGVADDDGDDDEEEGAPHAAPAAAAAASDDTSDAGEDGGSGGLPDLSGVMEDPEIVAMKGDPELAALMAEVQRSGPSSLFKHMGNPKVAKLMSVIMKKTGLGAH